MPMSSFRRELEELKPLLAEAAQKVYDEWNQDEEGMDEEFGGGGICDQVSQALADVISTNVSDVELFDGGQDGDDHAWTIAQLGGEAYGVDIPPNVYESGGGYSWRKIEGVKIQPGHIIVFPVPLQES